MSKTYTYEIINCSGGDPRYVEPYHLGTTRTCPMPSLPIKSAIPTCSTATLRNSTA